MSVLSQTCLIHFLHFLSSLSIFHIFPTFLQNSIYSIIFTFIHLTPQIWTPNKRLHTLPQTIFVITAKKYIHLIPYLLKYFQIACIVCKVLSPIWMIIVPYLVIILSYSPRETITIWIGPYLVFDNDFHNFSCHGKSVRYANKITD